jgi:hypothetical protein
MRRGTAKRIPSPAACETVLLAEHSTILTDLADGVWLDQFRMDASDGIRLVGSDDWFVQKRVLRGGTSDGIDVVSVNNGVLSFDVLPTRGMGLWRGACRGIFLGWQSPVKYPVHPSFVNLSANNGSGWLDGFNEWICRCGLESVGRPGCDAIHTLEHSSSVKQLTLHGRIANTPASHVSTHVSGEGNGRISVKGIVTEASMFGATLQLETSIETEVGSQALSIVDRVTNVGSQECEFQLMFHVNLGPPLLAKGSRLVASAAEITPFDHHAAGSIEKWDTFAGPTYGFAEQSYFLRLKGDSSGSTTVMLANSPGDKAICLTFSVIELPCFTLWKNTAGAGDGYVTGLEPGTSFPNPKVYERAQGRVPILKGGQTFQTTLKVEILCDAESVVKRESQE